MVLKVRNVHRYTAVKLWPGAGNGKVESPIHSRPALDLSIGDSIETVMPIYAGMV